MTEISLHTINQWNDLSLQMLYRNFYKALVLYASNIVGDSVNAEDVVQETFVRMWQKRPSFATTLQVKLYLYTTTHNLAVSNLRQTGRRGTKVQLSSLNTEHMPTTESGDEDFFTPEVYRRLLIMIENLSPRQREVFLMAMEGKKNAEIAKQLNISQNTVKVLKGRAIQTLKKEADEKSLFLLFFLLFS